MWKSTLKVSFSCAYWVRGSTNGSSIPSRWSASIHCSPLFIIPRARHATVIGIMSALGVCGRLFYVTTGCQSPKYGLEIFYLGILIQVRKNQNVVFLILICQCKIPILMTSWSQYNGHKLSSEYLQFHSTFSFIVIHIPQHNFVLPNMTI